uniref:exodeoxyribonuclease VII large subunit n=1 Tax=uncultured Hyphomicrobium sp. TaxID=194373 RepID=UPI0025FD2627
ARFRVVELRGPRDHLFRAGHQPRQRIDTASARLGRALASNTQAHHTRHIRVTSRLHTGLLANRLARAADRLDSFERRARECLRKTAAVRRAQLQHAAGRLQPAPIRHRVDRCGERLDAQTTRARRAMAAALDRGRRQLDGHGKLLASLGYQSVLARGFALVRDTTGAMIRSTAATQAGQAIQIEFADGRISADVTGTAGPGRSPSGPAPSAPSSSGEKAPPAARPRATKGQGSLF